MTKNLTKICVIEFGLVLGLFSIKSNLEKLSLKCRSPTLSAGMEEAPPGRGASYLLEILLTLDSICFCAQFQFHCDKQLARIQIIMSYRQPLSNNVQFKREPTRILAWVTENARCCSRRSRLSGGSSAGMVNHRNSRANPARSTLRATKRLASPALVM